MRRKVVKHGPATYIISLPSKWVKRYSIDKGDELDVVDEGNSLRISTEKGQTENSIELDISHLDRTSLMLMIRSLYKRGYNEIRLNFRNPSTEHHRLEKERSVISVIHEELNRLTGIEVVQEREDFAVLKVISVMSSKEMESILRRVFLLLLDVGQDFYSATVNQKYILVDTIEEKHNTVTKFLSFCMRVLNKNSGLPPKEAQILFAQCQLLDKIIDVYKNVSRIVTTQKPKFRKDSKSILANINKLFNLYYTLHYKYDKKKVVEIIELRDKTYRKLSDELPRLSNKEVIVVSNCISIVDLVLGLTELRISYEL